MSNTAIMHQPSSLATLCCSFIGPRLHQVESLMLVPDHLGFDMLRQFCEAASVRQLRGANDTDSRLAQVCRIMDEAFSESFCTCLCLDGVQLADANSPVCQRLLLTLPLMRWLRRLSLRGTQLWDGHSLVPVIAGAKRLRYLDVSNNVLTSEGVRKLTAPARYRQINQLVFLLLAGNRYLSSSCLKFLSQAESLKLVSINASLFSDQFNDQSAKACRAEFCSKFAPCGSPSAYSSTQCNCWAVVCGIIPNTGCTDDKSNAAPLNQGEASSLLFKRIDICQF